MVVLLPLLKPSNNRHLLKINQLCSMLLKKLLLMKKMKIQNREKYQFILLDIQLKLRFMKLSQLNL